MECWGKLVSVIVFTGMYIVTLALAYNCRLDLFRYISQCAFVERIFFSYVTVLRLLYGQYVTNRFYAASLFLQSNKE